MSNAEILPSHEGVDETSLAPVTAPVDFDFGPVNNELSEYDEMTLDQMLDQAKPEYAFALEEELIKEVKDSRHVTERLARVTLKAIALAQVARQMYDMQSETGDQTYANLGALMTKIFDSKHNLALQPGNEAHHESSLLTGVLSEATFYALAAYNSTLTNPLNGKVRGARPRYVLPTTRMDDLGTITRDPDSRAIKKTGIDFTVTYLEGDDPHRYVQVKTLGTPRSQDEYIPEIVVVPIRELSSSPNVLSLPRAITYEAGDYITENTYLQIAHASARLNELIK